MSEAHLWPDTTYTLRALRRNPGYAFTVILTLGLGLGVCAAAFSLINALLLRPLPFPEPEQLVGIWGQEEQVGRNKLDIAPLDLADMRESVPALANVGGFTTKTFNFDGPGGEPELVWGSQVTSGVFPTLGLRPTIGRWIQAEDEEAGRPVAVVSHGLWQRHFGGDPRILGRTILFDSRPYTVVGVMPPEFVFPLPTVQVWIPAQLGQDQLTHENSVFQVVGRLRVGGNRARAQAQLAALATSLAAEYPTSHAAMGFEVVPLRQELTFAHDIVELVSWILALAVGFVMLLVCANVANMAFARFAARTREVAIRTALGAGVKRLARQFLMESLVLSLAGGAVGLIIAQQLVRASATMVPDVLYRVGSLGVGASAALVTLCLAICSALLIGLLPSLRIVRSSVADCLSGGVWATDSRQGRRWLEVLVVAQLAVGTILLINALLMLRTVHHLLDVDPGFDTEVLSLTVMLPKARYESDEAIIGFVRDARGRISKIPSARSVAAVNFMPLNHETLRQSLLIKGRDLSDREKPSSIFLVASPDFFKTMGVSLLRGRAIDATDIGAAAPVAVINRSLADRFFPQGDPIGSQIAADTRTGEPRWRTVVGVVSDYHHVDLSGSVQPQVFFSFDQSPWSYMRLLVRADHNEGLALVPQVRSVLAEIAPDVPLTQPKLLGQVITDSLAPQRFTSAALVALGLGALLLAAVGLYGVMNFRVVRSTREIGMRMALGASQRSIHRLMLTQAVRLTGFGLGLGLVGAASLSFGLSRLLFGVRPLDPMVYAGVVLLLATVAVLAGLRPAFRASRLDPMEALRRE